MPSVSLGIQRQSLADAGGIAGTATPRVSLQFAAAHIHTHTHTTNDCCTACQSMLHHSWFRKSTKAHQAAIGLDASPGRNAVSSMQRCCAQGGGAIIPNWRTEVVPFCMEDLSPASLPSVQSCCGNYGQRQTRPVAQSSRAHCTGTRHDACSNAVSMCHGLECQEASLSEPLRASDP